MTTARNPASMDRTTGKLGKVWGYAKQKQPVAMRKELGRGSFSDAYLGENGKVYTETTPKDPSKFLMMEFRESLPPALRKHCPDIEYLGKKDVSPGSGNDIFRMPFYSRNYDTQEGAKQAAGFSPIQAVWHQMGNSPREDVLEAAKQRAERRGEDKNPYFKKFFKLFTLLHEFLLQKRDTWSRFDVPDRNLGWKGDDLIFMDVFFEGSGASAMSRSAAGFRGSAVSVTEPGLRREALKVHREASTKALDACVAEIHSAFGAAVSNKISKLTVPGHYGYVIHAPDTARIVIQFAATSPKTLRTLEIMPGQVRGDKGTVDAMDLLQLVKDFLDDHGAAPARKEKEIDDFVEKVLKHLALPYYLEADFVDDLTERSPGFWRARAPDGAEVRVQVQTNDEVGGFVGTQRAHTATPEELAEHLYQHGVRAWDRAAVPPAGNLLARLVLPQLRRIRPEAGLGTMSYPAETPEGTIATRWSTRSGQVQVIVTHEPREGRLHWWHDYGPKRGTASIFYADTVQGAYALVADVFDLATSLGMSVTSEQRRGVRTPTR
jgi:hypothetical protein